MKEEIKSRLAKLREHMAARNIAATVIPQGDPHLSEYVSSHWKLRTFFSGFHGSAGTMVVTADKAMLFLISAEDKAMHKHIRLNPELRIVSEIEFRGHEKIYVIDKKS